MATGWAGCAPGPTANRRTHSGLGTHRPGSSQLSREVQCSVASHIQGLVKSEKNRQVACEAGMLRTLMASCRQALAAGSGALHCGLVRIFEKLASQAIEPHVLRYLCRLGTESPAAAHAQRAGQAWSTSPGPPTPAPALRGRGAWRLCRQREGPQSRPAHELLVSARGQ